MCAYVCISLCAYALTDLPLFFTVLCWKEFELASGESAVSVSPPVIKSNGSGNAE
jgi:hypothetical protein